MSIDYYEKTMERYLFSISDGNFDGFYERIAESAIEFARGADFTLLFLQAKQCGIIIFTFIFKRELLWIA
ncbi:MAG: hypothetical protein OEV42_06065 [Deltaproteobacteria bacterium]|nr:hypothetical protein [Deltaproteobacteria bacterium]